MPDDDVVDLTGELRALDDDPPPAALLAAARAAFSWRTADADLCRPSYDSLLEDALTTRGEQSARLLRFEFEDLALDVEVSSEANHRSLVGQLTPAGQAELTVRHGGEAETELHADDLGRFVADDIRPGPLSIRVVAAEGTAVHTDWVLI